MTNDFFKNGGLSSPILFDANEKSALNLIAPTFPFSVKEVRDLVGKNLTLKYHFQNKTFFSTKILFFFCFLFLFLFLILISSNFFFGFNKGPQRLIEIMDVSNQSEGKKKTIIYSLFIIILIFHYYLLFINFMKKKTKSSTTMEPWEVV